MLEFTIWLCVGSSNQHYSINPGLKLEHALLYRAHSPIHGHRSIMGFLNVMKPLRVMKSTKKGTNAKVMKVMKTTKARSKWVMKLKCCHCSWSQNLKMTTSGRFSFVEYYCRVCAGNVFEIIMTERV